MTARAHAAVAADAPAIAAATLQRACACGGSAGVEGKCASCAEEDKLGVQTKLRINPPGDRWEQEADRIADTVVSDRPAPMNGPLAVTPLIQRQAEEEEEEEEPLQAKAAVQRQADEEEEEELQAKAAPTAGASRSAPPPDIAASAVAQGGHPLPQSERAYFEPRFGRDLSGVRLHTDARAAAAAEGIGARAYTLRNRIAFARGQYAPGTTEGRRLMAHELTHTLQQGGAGNREAVQRDIFEQIAGLFRGDDFSADELRAYLRHILDSGAIEDNTDSDNKARAVVNRLRNGEDLFGREDSGTLRALLVREMQSGFTGNDDERAILYLLETADEAQLEAMFTSGGLTADSLDSDFQGAEQRQLDAFFESRFQGGRAALERGRIRPRPPRSGTPFDQMTVEQAERRLEIVEGLIAEAMAIQIDRMRSLQERRDLDRTASDPGTVLGLRGQEERRGADRMNRQPLEVIVTGSRIVFRVRFHIRFEDASMRSRATELTQSLRDGIAQVWNQRISGGTFGGREFVMQPEISEIGASADRDQRYWLLSVRSTDLEEPNYSGCTFDETIAGVPTSVTNIDCQGGLISIPPSHISRPGIIGHETLHLFGLIDRYMTLTNRTSETGPVTRHENVPDRETPGRADPLGTEEGTIISEDLAFVLDTQGAYEREIVRRSGGRSLAALQAEAARLREIIELGRDPRSLIQPREDFNRELFRSADDI